MTNLEASVMWANASIARNEEVQPESKPAITAADLCENEEVAYFSRDSSICKTCKYYVRCITLPSGRL